jgi:hypothetical protein
MAHTQSTQRFYTGNPLSGKSLCTPEPRQPRATAHCQTLRLTRGGGIPVPPWDPLGKHSMHTTEL